MLEVRGQGMLEAVSPLAPLKHPPFGHVRFCRFAVAILGRVPPHALARPSRLCRSVRARTHGHESIGRPNGNRPFWHCSGRRRLSRGVAVILPA